MKKVLGLLGLSCRAGQVILGAEMALKEIKAGHAALVLLDESTSEGTRKKITDACAYRHVPLHMLPTDAISQACGKDGRMAAAIRPGKLCQQLLLLLTGPENNGQS